MSINPENINTDQHFWSAFGHMETEVSARWIVRFCQQRGQGWNPFTSEEIEQFYNRDGYTKFRFNRLLDKDQHFIRILEEGIYEVTPEFITRCYNVSPQ